MKKAGGYLKSILPLVAMLGIQFAASTVQMIRFMVQYGVEEGTQIYMNDTMTVLLISDVLLLGVAGLCIISVWYGGGRNTGSGKCHCFKKKIW